MIVITFILLITLYGDLIKRYFTPDESLAILYISSVIILAYLLIKKHTNHIKKIPKVLFIILISIYLIDFMATINMGIDLIIPMSYVVYIIVPILFALAIARRADKFDLTTFIIFFFIFIIPINLVGFIQYFFDPNFFISTSYASSGGIIERNMGDIAAKTFLRYPSIFTSADRYAGISFIQVCFSLIALNNKNIKRRFKFFILIILLMGLASVVIAGARSVMIQSIVVIVAYLIAKFIEQTKNKNLIKYTFIFVLTLLSFYLLYALLLFRYTNLFLNLPSINFFIRSSVGGDITSRVDQSLSLSTLPESVTLFGQGLGVLAMGKPAEFGVYSAWIESGLIIGGAIILTSILIIIYFLREILKEYSKEIVVCCFLTLRLW